jgi:hypothetical protein
MKPLYVLGVMFVLAMAIALSGWFLGKPPPQGVAALVNGRPVTLRMVEARHDDDGGPAAIARNPSVDLLQRQYGAVLAELIVQELVVQELERMGFPVTDADVEQLVAEIRGDYAGENFDDLLFEEHVDGSVWRALLRYMLAMRRFSEQVLRPQISLGEDEVEKYYAAHAAEFLTPSRLSFLVLTGSSQKAVADARDRVLAGGSQTAVPESPDVQSQRVDIRPAQLPEVWQEEAGRLAVGKASRIRELSEGFQCLILERRNPARAMSPVEAYLRIEPILVETKMEELFAQWLEASLTGARISVAAQLLPRNRNNRGGSPEEAEPRNSEPILDNPASDNGKGYETGAQ